MKVMRSRIVLGVALAAMLFPTGRTLARSPLSSRIDIIFSSVLDSGSPGAAVLVRRHGQTVFERGYGVRDLRSRARIDDAANFRLASLSKQFTAMAIMLLVHDGKLQYDRKVTEIFPDFPAYGRGITIRHLLTHTSGLQDYEDLMAATDAGQPRWTTTHQIRDEDVLRLLEGQTSGKFAPGTSWSYSNSGYVLLGLIVARVSGEPFGRFLQTRVFEPLHMTRTLAWINGENHVPNRAYGYAKGPDGFVPSDQSPTSATLGDGGVYSNLTDLGRWDEALERHVLLTREEMQVALEPARLANGAMPSWPATPGEDNLAPGKLVAYGFGWFLDPWRGHMRMWHFGSTAGFRTAIERFTTHQMTTVVLCNRTDLDPGKYALEVADLVLAGK